MKKNKLALSAVLAAIAFLALSCNPAKDDFVLDIQTLLETIPRMRLNLPTSLQADSQVSNRAITVLDGSDVPHAKSEFWTKLQDSSGILLVDYADLINQTIRSYAIDYKVTLDTITDMQLPDAIAEGLL